jgi:hypothetical protein
VGSDVYLNWKGKTDEDKKAQITGFSIDAGNKGYLRASIGMTTENHILRAVFPEKYWEGKELEYDFSEKKYELLQKIGWRYLVCSVMGVELGEEDKSGKLVFETLKAGLNKDINFDEVVMPKSGEFRYAVMWLNSLFDFYQLGMKKQKEGKKPSVRISW